ncbi:hypothetical protein E1B28_005555 [Marasmius oreades]|uniref:Uncharacterized protein n=1 Tax=Marasmius oreades TaxID=181124 RepID=A0A9P7S3Q0_9AGAR|nr:uncharacterized protein E1B28_005555 [Marasmius oreades]KAG7094737.1 hypothetical protein E1B28_005555 [Marasmius oreades]
MHPIAGTKEFMAVEYAMGYYLHAKVPLLQNDPLTWSVDTDRHVIFNYYHDAESVAWIYLWFLYHRFPSSIYEVLTPNKRAELRTLYEGGGVYFWNGADSRLPVTIGKASILARRFQNIYHGNEELVTPLMLFLHLREAYRNLEKEPQQPPTQDGCSHWPRSLFSLELYETRIAHLQQILEIQSSRGNLAVPVKPTRILLESERQHCNGVHTMHL